MNYLPKTGCTVFGIAGFTDHLIIICTDPIFYSEYGCEAVLSVNVTSWKNGALLLNDSTCVLEVGDHPFIRHKSFILYKEAVPLRVPSLISKIQLGELIPMEPMKEDVLSRILDGFNKSPEVSRKAKRFLKLASATIP